MVIKTSRKKLTKSEVKRLIGKLKKKLKQEEVPVKKLFLFGSYAKGKPHIDSDIDIAVILPSGANLSVRRKASQISWWAKQTDVKLEAHVLSENDFKNRWLSLPAEIKKHGIVI